MLDQRPKFARFDEYDKTGRVKGEEHPGATMILRNMHLVKPSEIPPRPDICCAIPMPPRQRKGKK
jgi:hypothetical protein